MELKLKLLAGAALALVSAGATAQDAAQQQPTGDASAQTAQGTTASSSADLKAVTAADAKAGTAVNDTKGNPVGKVESVKSKSAVISTGVARAEIPLSSLGRNDKGLVIAMTKAEFDAAAKAKTRKQ
jgi:hypothetical protein